MEDLDLPCLRCASPIEDGDYCTVQCGLAHLAEQVARRSGATGICDWCYSPVRGTKRRRYCSPNCGARARHRPKQFPLANCEQCGTGFPRRTATRRFCSVRCGEIHRGRLLPQPLPRQVCALAECDAEFQPVKTGQRCCSEAHGKKLWNRKNPEPWNDRKRDHYHRRKALKKGTSTGRPVRLAEIRERDKNRCHLCEKRVPDKAWPHPLSPSLDHVIPLSKGGIHDPDNVRLAHLRCNVEKGADGGNEQLLLIG